MTLNLKCLLAARATTAFFIYLSMRQYACTAKRQTHWAMPSATQKSENSPATAVHANTQRIWVWMLPREISSIDFPSFSFYRQQTIRNCTSIHRIYTKNIYLALSPFMRTVYHSIHACACGGWMNCLAMHSQKVISIAAVHTVQY